MLPVDEMIREKYEFGYFVVVYKELSDRYYWVSYDILARQFRDGLYIPVGGEKGLPMVQTVFRSILTDDEMYDVWNLFRKYLKRYMDELIRKRRVPKKEVYKLFNKTPPISEWIGRFKIRVEDTFGYLYGLDLNDALELGKELAQLLEKSLVTKEE